MKNFIASTVISAGFAAAAVIPRGYSVNSDLSSQVEDIFSSATSELATYMAPEIPSDYTYTPNPSIAYSVWASSEIEALFTSTDSSSAEPTSTESTFAPAYSTWPSSSIEGIFTSTDSFPASTPPSDYTYTEPTGPVFSTYPVTTTSDGVDSTPVQEYTTSTECESSSVESYSTTETSSSVESYSTSETSSSVESYSTTETSSSVESYSTTETTSSDEYTTSTESGSSSVASYSTTETTSSEEPTATPTSDTASSSTPAYVMTSTIVVNRCPLGA